MTVDVEVWTDINCPFCYLGKARFEQALEGFAHRADVRVVHRSFELDPAVPAEESGSVVEHIAHKYGIPVAQAEANERGLGAQAAEAGLEYQTSGRDYGNSFDMHRILHLALEQGVQERVLDALYAANFADTAPLFGDRERLVEVAVGAGLAEADVRRVLDSDEYADAVRADEEQAAAFGASGVPFFVFDRRYAVSGAQPAEVFTDALERAWADAASSLQVVADGDACGPDGCAVPQR
ncbi:DsbA family oxidoreductase [Tsukamurella sp. 8J]|uniref:DsbA family oxidoreductase n=1 Tax=Tsukamurella sp. 8J TaxID=3031962 RepID=UPI0023B98329|nr:DsbA family oxidoreductase [Tsukamurella sp. 8J]MDF0530039.1 DsbA family oxidoreductase [Tsukamurella sp. 8J]